MTFPVPSVAGVFLSLSNRLKTAITDGSAAHYLLGRTPTRLRNHLGFHAALAEMADALLERAVLPYQITSSLPSLTVLPTAQLSGTDVSPVQVEAKVNLPAILATVSQRAKLGTEKRYAPLEFWRAILDGINSLSSSQDAFLWPRSAASENYADVVVYPPVYRTVDIPDYAGTGRPFVDLHDSGWGVRCPYEYDVAVNATNSLVDTISGTRGDVGSCYMLSKLIFDFAYEPDAWQRIFALSAKRLMPLEGLPPSLISDLAISSLPDGKLNGLTAWSPMEPVGRIPGRRPTARPNLDLLHIYQVLLGCFWANWAKMEVEVKVPHLVTTRTAGYTVYWDGSLSQNSDSTATDVVEKTNRLEWSHGISYSTDGEWSNGGIYGGTAHIGFHMSELLQDASAVDEAVSDARRQIDNAWAAYEQAEATWRMRGNELDRALDTAFSNIPASARDQFAQDLMDSVNDVQGLTYINTINIYANGSFVDTWIFYNPLVYLPMSFDQAKDAFDRFRATIRNSSRVEDADGNLTFVVNGAYSFGISVPEVAAAGRSISNARQIERSAYNAMHSAYDDYEQAVDSYGPTAQDGVSVDVTDEIRFSAVSSSRIEWDGEEPRHPASQDPVQLTVVSTETHPIAGSGSQSLRALLMAGGSSGTRTSPWPAESLIDGSYVKSEKVAIGARMKDKFDDTENNGYYNYRETSDEPPEGGSRYRATRNANSYGEKAPTEKTFRRLLVDDGTPEATAPSRCAESAVSRLVEDATSNVSAGTVGGDLPLMLYGIHPHGRAGVESTDDWTVGIGPFYAWYHPDKSAKAYKNSEGIYHYQGPDDPSPVPAGYSFTNKYCPWQITGPAGLPVYWNWDDGYPAEITCSFSYVDDARSQSASAENPPHLDRLVVELSRHLAVRSEWNWKSMPVTYT